MNIFCYTHKDIQNELINVDRVKFSANSADSADSKINIKYYFSDSRIQY